MKPRKKIYTKCRHIISPNLRSGYAVATCKISYTYEYNIDLKQLTNRIMKIK